MPGQCGNILLPWRCLEDQEGLTAADDQASEHQPRHSPHPRRRRNRRPDALGRPARPHRPGLDTSPHPRQPAPPVARHSSWRRRDSPFEQDRNRNSVTDGDTSVNIVAADHPGRAAAIR